MECYVPKTYALPYTAVNLSFPEVNRLILFFQPIYIKDFQCIHKSFDLQQKIYKTGSYGGEKLQHIKGQLDAISIQ